MTAIRKSAQQPRTPPSSGSSAATSPRPEMSDHKQPTSPLTEYEHISHPSSSLSSSSSSSRPKAKLIYCKSHVSIHPTQFNKDNISGYLGIVEADGSSLVADVEGNVQSGQSGKELLVTWVPDELLARMDKDDREGYKTVDSRTGDAIPTKQDDGDYVFVTIPPPRGEKYAFSVSISSIYSILVYPPSLSRWYGSATFNLLGGVSLPTLYFHDDESPVLAETAKSASPTKSVPKSKWGFPPFLNLIQTRATVLKSRLITGRANHNAELWLINPSKSDREVHEAGIEEDRKAASNQPTEFDEKNTAAGPSYPPPKGGMPDARVLMDSDLSPKQFLLGGLSQITNFSRRTANQLTQQVLATPLAREVVPHLPPAVRSLVNAQGEWERSGRLPPKTGKSDLVTEFESARLYLARWARVVAEEGERARRTEVAGKAGLSKTNDQSTDDLTSSLGVFSLLDSPNSKRPLPNTTRTPHKPITASDWDSFAAQGRDELWVRREIFQRGFTDSPEPDQKRARREGWEVLLGIVNWDEGGLGEGDSARVTRQTAREARRQQNREKYAEIKAKWENEASLQETEEWKEEWHRIDVDCRRTDRTQPTFAIPAEAMKLGEGERETDKKRYTLEEKVEAESGQASLNPHVAALRTVLMTYHTYAPDLGYVQGMSDLLSPIYVVLDNNEADAFWGLVGVMKMMESNFLRDQSGMRLQLSTLQQLIGVMDPDLYAHLERTDSLNLFFCFRWILISFKREFKFDDVIRLWDVLWTDYYSKHFVLFIALAVLQSHRDVILRYLTEFDEVLKYANNLSGTIELESTLAQAEVLFLSFRNLVTDFDEQNAAKEETDTKGLRRRTPGDGNKGSDEGGKTASTDDDITNKKSISPQLRELLEGWQPKV